MKKLLIILCLFSSFIHSADKKAVAEIWVIYHERSLKLKGSDIDEIKEIIDNIFNQKALFGFQEYSARDIKSRVKEKLEDKLWYLLLNDNDQKDLDFILEEFIQEWDKEHDLVVDKESSIWAFIDKLINNIFDFTVSFKPNNYKKVYLEVVFSICDEVRILPEFKKMRLSSKAQVIDYIQCQVLYHVNKFRKS